MNTGLKVRLAEQPLQRRLPMGIFHAQLANGTLHQLLHLLPALLVKLLVGADAVGYLGERVVYHAHVFLRKLTL